MIYNQNTVYFLKRRYGGYAVLFRITGKTLNLETGLQTITQTSTIIKKAVFLPTNVSRQIITRSDFYYDPDKRLVLIDRRDIDFVITIGDFIIFEQSKYNIIEVNDYTINDAFLLVVQSDGRSKYLLADDTLTITSIASQVTI